MISLGSDGRSEESEEMDVSRHSTFTLIFAGFLLALILGGCLINAPQAATLQPTPTPIVVVVTPTPLPAEAFAAADAEEQLIVNIYERVSKLVEDLSREREGVAIAPQRADAVARALTPLTAPAGRAIENDMLAHNLSTRVNQISATLRQLASNPDIDPDAIQRMEAEADLVIQQLDALSPRIAAAEAAGQEVQAVAQLFPAQKRAADQTPGLLTQVVSLLERAQRLQSDLPGAEFTPPPGVQDIREEMPRHPAKTWPSRAPSQIQLVMVHHTVTSPAIDPITLAQAVIAHRDLPGLPYHFLVQGDGDGYWAEPLETEVGQTLKDDINRKSVAVALAGNFTNDPPSEAQLNTAAAIIAQLVKTFALNVDEDVIGRNEVEVVASPGRQWLQGARYKFTLLEKVRTLLDG